MKFNKVIHCNDLPTLYKVEYYTDENHYKKFIFIFPTDDKLTVICVYKYGSFPEDKDIDVLQKVY